ncbi:MAG: Na+-transporting methylmalonyl-CoA/oxaloacetate decarboxylase gamma subunit [Psychromonas sp.]|jgi:Na+-transporting methylmalonyl-CoA/oxaloacetate decarboxylase gamma subunit
MKEKVNLLLVFLFLLISICFYPSMSQAVQTFPEEKAGHPSLSTYSSYALTI